MGKNKNKYSFNSVSFITYVWSKRRFLLTVSVIAAIVSAIVSLTITPKYRSSVILFPASSGSISKLVLSTGNNSQEDLLRFGTEQESEQLMQILGSGYIRERIVQKYNLLHHYRIDTTKRFWRTKLTRTYEKNISFHLTEYMSVVIDVLDENPDTAAYIANEISNQVDTTMTNVQRDRARKALVIVENEYTGMVAQMNQMEDSLRHIRELGVINYDKQSEAFNRAYATALVQGRTAGTRILEDKLKILAKYGGAYVALSELEKNETERLSALREKYMEVKVDAEQTIPHKYVVDKAYRSETKALPKRSLIVLFSTISSFFVALLFLIFRDSVVKESKDLQK